MISAQPINGLAPAALGGKSAVFALAAGMLALAALALACAVVGLGSVSLTSESEPGGVSALAARDIPPEYLALYRQAARRYGLDWSVLAGIGRVECDHGRDPDPSCGAQGAVNGAGAGGPMQFLASTWEIYGVDGDGDGVRDRWDAADAIFSAANYLHASGAPRDYRQAIYAYNHAAWYVAEVEQWAGRYRDSGATGASIPVAVAGLAPSGLQTVTPTQVQLIGGDRAELAPGDGHLALIPAEAPSAVQAMVIAGNELQDLVYGPGGHPDPRGVGEEDCSSTINYVLYRSGVRPIAEILARNPLAQDYVSWGAPGPGRWVTIYSTVEPTPHTFITIAGLRLDTSHNGTDVGPNRDQDGPRWRILDDIPTWAHWSVRHPPGL